MLQKHWLYFRNIGNDENGKIFLANTCTIFGKCKYSNVREICYTCIANIDKDIGNANNIDPLLFFYSGRTLIS